MPNNIDDLYTQLTEQGAEGLGTQQQFREYMQSADNTKSLHAQLTEQGVEGLGTPDLLAPHHPPRHRARSPHHRRSRRAMA